MWHQYDQCGKKNSGQFGTTMGLWALHSSTKGLASLPLHHQHTSQVKQLQNVRARNDGDLPHNLLFIWRLRLGPSHPTFPSPEDLAQHITQWAQERLLVFMLAGQCQAEKNVSQKATYQLSYLNSDDKTILYKKSTQFSSWLHWEINPYVPTALHSNLYNCHYLFISESFPDGIWTSRKFALCKELSIWSLGLNMRLSLSCMNLDKLLNFNTPHLSYEWMPPIWGEV